MLNPAITLPHTLVPVALAVQVIWSRVYPGSSPTSRAGESLLNSFAATLAKVGTLYEYLDGAKPSALARAQVLGGEFRGGGRELHFDDGRAPRRHLAVPADDVPKAIEAVRRQWPKLSAWRTTATNARRPHAHD